MFLTLTNLFITVATSPEVCSYSILYWISSILYWISSLSNEDLCFCFCSRCSFCAYMWLVLRMKDLRSSVPQANLDAWGPMIIQCDKVQKEKQELSSVLRLGGYREQRRHALLFEVNWGEKFFRQNKNKQHRSRIMKSSELWERNPRESNFGSRLSHLSCILWGGKDRLKSQQVGKSWK